MKEHRVAMLFLDQSRVLAAAPELFEQARREFSTLPLYHRGQSKEIRATRQSGILIQRFLPTVYSYTSNRVGVVPGTDRVRMAVSQVFWQRLHRAGIRSCVLEADGEFALITHERVPPVEVIVKAALVGTPAHLYEGLFEQVDRFGTPLVKGARHRPYCRFDYRNPLTDARGNRLRDEQLPLALADRFLNVVQAERTALRVFDIVQEVCRGAGYEALDLCLMFDATGLVVCNELSPDNMRIKKLAPAEDFDKDIWRKGGTAQELLLRWRGFQADLETHDGRA